MDYEKLLMKELKVMCKERKIKHYSVMNKAGICDLLRRNDIDPTVTFDEEARAKSQKNIERIKDHLEHMRVIKMV